MGVCPRARSGCGQEGSSEGAHRHESECNDAAAQDQQESASAPVGDAGTPTARRDPRQEIRALRERNYAAAHRLAARHALDPFLRSVEIGLGFFIEPPEPSAVPTESKEAATLPGDGLVLNGIRSGSGGCCV